MTDIIFVNPPYERISKGHDYIKHITNSSPSLGLLHLAAQTREDGYETKIIEGDLENLMPEEVADIIIKESPKFVGITLFTVGVENASIIAGNIKKELPNIPILVGGPHMSSMGIETMNRFPMFDVAVLHEGEQVISKLLKLLEENKPLDVIDGIIYKNENNKLIRTAPATIRLQLDDLPLPAWDLLPNFPDAYPLAIFDYPKGPVTTFSASRGCPFKCAFCDTSTFGSKIRYYSPAKVFEIMNYLKDTYGINHLQFVDDLFVANKKRILELCDLIIEHDFKMTWSCTARVDSITLDILKKMKQAGCWEISYGIETGSDRMLKNMRKATKVEQSRKAINWTHEAGIRAKGLFMLGYPGEDEESMRETKEFVQSIPLTTMNMSKFTPYPGSPIYMELYGTSIRDEDWDRMNGMNFIWEPENVSMEYLNQEYKDILESFYHRNEILVYYLKMSLSFPTHIFRLARFGLAFLFSKIKSKLTL